MKKFYICAEGESFVLRQSRFKALLQAGSEHPHDICAMAQKQPTLLSMLASAGISLDEVELPLETAQHEEVACV